MTQIVHHDCPAGKRRPRSELVGSTRNERRPDRESGTHAADHARVRGVGSGPAGQQSFVSGSPTRLSSPHHAGVAPTPVWSGNNAGRVRMTRSGTCNSTS